MPEWDYQRYFYFRIYIWRYVFIWTIRIFCYIILSVYNLVLNSSWRNIGNVETVFLRIQVNFLCEVHPSNLLFQSCHVKIVGFELKLIPITKISTIFILNYYNKSYQFNGSHYSVFSIVRPPIVRGFVRACVHIVCMCVYVCENINRFFELVLYPIIDHVSLNLI